MKQNIHKSNKWTKNQYQMYMMGQKDCYRHLQRLLDREMLATTIKMGFWRRLEYFLMGPRHAILRHNLDLHHTLIETIDHSIDHLENNLP